MNKRLVGMFCSLALASLLLFLRVGSISMSDELAETAAAQSRYTLSFGETRGMIYDTRMLPLVDESESYIASVLPTPENMAALLKTDALSGDISALMETGRPFLAECSEPDLDIPGVKVFPVKNRTCSDQLARHVIGYLDSGGQGVTGIEKAFDNYLSQDSRQTSITYTVDGRRSPLAGVEPVVDYAPTQTEGVVLTIDRRIQEIVEEAGKKYLNRGAIVVMEPSTGKIRALASFPQYDPLNLGDAVLDEESAPLINRAFSAYNVGSTFKVVTTATALTDGFPSYRTYDCKGYIEVLTQTFKCHDLAGHGLLDLQGALEESCNPYFIDLGLELDKEEFVNMASDMSFGKATLFAEGFASSAGVLPTVADLYNPAAVGNFAFGQGTLTATPIQIAQMMSCVVNGGGTPSASLVEGLTEDGKLLSQRKVVSSPVKAMGEDVVEQIKGYLVNCVMETPNQNAKPNYVTAGGKTGTAQTGQIKEDGDELLQGWFAGFFPAEDPQYVVVVLSEDAKSGNQNASPAFRYIADSLYAPLEIPDALKTLH